MSFNGIVFEMWEQILLRIGQYFMNFEKFNFNLPFIPKSEEHYLSIDDFSWEKLNKTLQRISINENSTNWY